jgi:DNA-binding MarR family transcriptional regulator
MAAMKENTKAIFMYLKEHNGEQITAQEIADALGLGVKSVIGSVNSFVKKEWAVRSEPVKVEINGEKKDVKFISLTDAGLAVDPDAE